MNARSGRLPLAVLALLAWRNLWRHRRRTLITLSSVALGFGLSVLVIGLNDGQHNSMIRNAIRLGEGHITVQPRGYLEAPANYKYLADGAAIAAKLERLGVVGRIEPRISLQVLASTANNSVGAALESVGAGDEERVSMLRPRLVSGSWIDPGDRLGVVIGDAMARKLKADIGGRIVMIAGQQGGDTQAQLGLVRGIFNSGVDEMDEFLILGGIGLAREFLIGEGADAAKEPVTRFALFLEDAGTLARWKAALAMAVEMDDVAVLDWREMMPQLVQFVAIDDAGSYVFLTLILMLVVFGILNTVLMSVLERTRELGLLRALGLRRSQLLALVFSETLILSLLASAAGWIAGGGAHLWFSIHGLDLSALIRGGTQMMGTFVDPVIRTELSWPRIVQLTLLVFLSTLASGIYPAIKAARVTPVQALRT